LADRENHVFKPGTTFEQAVRLYEFDSRLRRNEQFVRAFKRKYSDPLPPSWMTLEITSFGTMSILYQQLKPGLPKRDVAAAFGVSDTVFASWLLTVSLPASYSP